MPRQLTAVELHKLARSAALRGERLRTNSYALGEGGYEANLAAISKLLDEAAQVGTEEHEALKQLNERLRVEGAEPLQRRVVGGHLYRVSTVGNAAFHLGPECPVDEVESDREAFAERMAEYASSR